MKYSIMVAFLLAVFAGGNVLAGPVNVNVADAGTLAKELNGIGLAKARAIVLYRKSHGPYKSLRDLEKVKGIGHVIVERNKTNIRFVDEQMPQKQHKS